MGGGTRFRDGARATAVALGPGGRIVVVGASGPGHDTSGSYPGDDFALACYRGD